MLNSSIFKEKKIVYLLMGNIFLFLLLLITGYLFTNKTAKTESLTNELTLSHQYISTLPEGVKIELDCEQWYCTKFSNRTKEVPTEDSPSYVYLKDLSDSPGPNKMIFYADDYKIDGRFCDIVDNKLLEIPIFWKDGVNCEKLIFGNFE